MATKPTRKTATAQATDATIKNDAERIESLKQTLHMDSETFWERMGFRAYSVQATMTKLVARVVLYAIGMVSAIYCVGLLSAILQTAGWPLFLVAVIEIIGFVLGFIAAWSASDAIVDYIAAGHVSRDLKRAGSWLSSKLVSPVSSAINRMQMH